MPSVHVDHEPEEEAEVVEHKVDYQEEIQVENYHVKDGISVKY